jgi:hypothetical protein
MMAGKTGVVSNIFNIAARVKAFDADSVDRMLAGINLITSAV